MPLTLRWLSAAVASLVLAGAVFPPAAAQTLSSIIEQLRANAMMGEDDRHLDAIVSCIVDRGDEAEVGSSFEERTGITFSLLGPLLNSEAEERRLRTGLYEDYGFGDALALGVAPLINPGALESTATAYAVPGHVLLASADEDQRAELLTEVISGNVAATRYTESGGYEPVSPPQDGWPDVLHAIRSASWDENARGHWENGRLTVLDPTDPAVERDGLQFIVLGDSRLADTPARNPVIAWATVGDLPDSVRSGYSESLYLNVVDVALRNGCIVQP